MSHTEAAGEGHAAGHDHGHDHAHHEPGFWGKYIFSQDHKIIGIQFLFTTLGFFFIGGLLALAVRWQLAYPSERMPIIGDFLFENGVMNAKQYAMLFTMHASIMIFFAIIPMLNGAFGNFLIPLMIGARDMAFPILNMLSYWLFWPGALLAVASFFVDGGAAGSGWTGYPPLSDTHSVGMGQTMWAAAVFLNGVAGTMGAINYITTIIKMRAPGMTMFRMPLTVWSLFITSLLTNFATPVLGSAMLMLILDRTFDASLFVPAGTVVSGAEIPRAGGGQPLLWQHLFWFYSHPAVYIMILPAMGCVSDIIATFARKPIFGYKPMVYSISGIAGLGFIVWGHHMFMSGMNPALGTTFMITTMMIALPSAVKTFNWIGTLWGARIRFTTPMLFSLAFVSMFIIGGLSGIFMAATPVDMYIHDTYFIVGHIHYVLFGGTMLGMFGAIYYWFPKMFGKMMSDKLGKLHFLLTFIFFNCTFFTMHIVGVGGMPRRLMDPSRYPYLQHLTGLNEFMTISALLLGAAQLIFIFNFLWTLAFGEKVEGNVWEATTLEWTDTPNPPGHGNFIGDLPRVYRGPYEYASPLVTEDYLPQSRNLEENPGVSPA
ncbi:MAG: cytochrome c oxidase subunit I [Planctomycetota bacterium]|jgi:cytochrome c oxidase subunit 1